MSVFRNKRTILFSAVLAAVVIALGVALGGYRAWSNSQNKVQLLRSALQSMQTAAQASQKEVVSLREALELLQARAQATQIEANTLQVEVSALKASLQAVQDVREGRLGSVLPFLDHVDLYQKNGLIESYGGFIDQRRVGPIGIGQTVLTPTSSEAWLIWSPEGAPKTYADQIRIRLGSFLEQGTLSVGVITASDDVVRWEMTLGPAVATIESPPDLDATRREKMLGVSPVSLTKEGRDLVGPVPPEVAEAARKGTIKTWFVTLSGAAASQAVGIEKIVLTDGFEPKPVERTRIEGQILSAKSDTVDKVTVVLENGDRHSAIPSPDGRFRFEDVPAGRPLSVRARVAGRDHYAARGRWFQAYDPVTRIAVEVEPEFSNPEKRPINVKDVVLRSPDTQLAFPRYRPQALINWPGTPAVQTFYREIEPLRPVSGPPMQEFLGRSFTNRTGFVDRERFKGNRDRCLRIAHVGGSSSVAIQVQPYEKFNILLEQELGTRLGRCVEVISAGRDNGDMGAVYPIVRDYLASFKPDVLLIEHMQLLALQIEPLLLRRLHGWE